MQHQALWFRRFGPPAQALELEAGELGPRPPGRVRVRMRLAPVNPSDLVPITGAYSHRVQPPLVAGYEGLGVVTEADAADARLLGRRVLPLRGQGTWQTELDCDPAWLVPVPEAIDDGLACRAYINPLAALRMLRRWPVRGRRVLLTAGGSTCAALLAQWALADGAAEVVAIHRAPGHEAGLRALGASTLPIGDLEAVAAAAARAEVIFEAVGGGLAELILSHAPAAADFVSYGLLSGAAFRTPPTGPRPQRFHLRDELSGIAPETWQGWFAELWPRLAASRLPPLEPFALGRWREALELFQRSGRTAKPALLLS